MNPFLADIAEAAATEQKNNLIPDPIPGRVAHIDADFLAYMCSAEGAEEKSWETMTHNASEMVSRLQALAGATAVHLHLTPSTSNKGMRYSIAVQKEYQGNRLDKPKPRLLHSMRDWLASTYPGTLHALCEADDGMTAAQYHALANGTKELSVIVSKDKDLRMCPGWHLDWDTGSLLEVNDFGFIELVESVSPSGLKTKKPYGFGPKWFWMQMLIGDGADNIQGLPTLSGTILNVINPTKATEKANAVLKSESSTEKQKVSAAKVLAQRKDGLCGPVTAEKLLANCSTSQQAFLLVRSLYEDHGRRIGFKHWKTGEEVSWQQVFISEAVMLWMRVNKDDPADVLDYLNKAALGEWPYG